MEYYALILNRTYLVRVGDGHISGSVCRGLTAVEGGGDRLTREITARLAVHGELNDPASYVDTETLSKRHRANFAIALSEVRSVTYDPTKKWGMGYYPHDGRVTVTTSKQKREFIILGGQSGRDIARRLNLAVEAA
jgi:hypothetical protein